MSARAALVTGGGSGVGAAIALALARDGCALHLVGRRLDALQAVADAARALGVLATCHVADLADDAALQRLCATLATEALDVLVHAAGTIERAPVADGSLASFDAQQRVNLRAPYALTQALLPALKATRGEIVFVNSSSGVTARAGGGAYDASKHGLRGLADALRAEVNADGVRVLSVYLGRTATPMQAALAHAEGRAYAPERLIQPGDVAQAVLALLRLPRSAEATDLHLRPTMD